MARKKRILTQTLKIMNNLEHKDTDTSVQFIFTLLLTMWLTIFSSKKGFSVRIKIKI